MNTATKMTVSGERTQRLDVVRPVYLEALTLVERLHRRLLDVIKDEFDRRGGGDINAVHARSYSLHPPAARNQHAPR